MEILLGTTDTATDVTEFAANAVEMLMKPLKRKNFSFSSMEASIRGATVLLKMSVRHEPDADLFIANDDQLESCVRKHLEDVWSNSIGHGTSSAEKRERFCSKVLVNGKKLKRIEKPVPQPGPKIDDEVGNEPKPYVLDPKKSTITSGNGDSVSLGINICDFLSTPVDVVEDEEKLDSKGRVVRVVTDEGLIKILRSIIVRLQSALADIEAGRHLHQGLVPDLLEEINRL